MHLDETGNICQANGDAGDSAQRTGFLGSVLKFRERLSISNTAFLESTPWSFERQWPTFFTPDKRLIRSPRGGDSIPKWNDPTDTSRDQNTPFIIACGLRGMTEQVEWLKPKGFIIKGYQNKDIASPGDMNTVRRCLGLDPTWFGDFWNAQGVAIRLRMAAQDPDDVGDDLNCFISSVFSYLVKPTTTSTATLRRYLKERPRSEGYYKMGLADPVLGALAWYFRPESGGNPELADICAEVISVLRDRLGCKIR